MNNTNLTQYSYESKEWLDTYMYSSMIFYGAYGILCLFFFKWYCRNIYFRGYYPKNVRWFGAKEGDLRWTKFHNTDGPMDYMTRGAGECCIVMAYSVVFVIQLIIAIKNIVEGDDPKNYLYIGDNFLTVQIVTWLMWTFTEIYYTWKQVEWELIGPVHVILCLIVLSFSINAKIMYSNWMNTII
jgi:hypothetical protein